MSFVSIRFRVDGKPKGQPRTKSRAILSNKMSKKGKPRIFSHHYTPKTAEEWRAAIHAAAEPHIPDEPMDGPVRIVLRFAMPRPCAHHTASNKDRGLKADAPFWCLTKPDGDNMEKLVWDELDGLGFFTDDARICSWAGDKVYTDPDDDPGVYVYITDPSEEEPFA